MIIDAHVHIGKLEEPPFNKSFEINLALLEDEMVKSGVGAAMVLADYEGIVDPDTSALIELLSEKKNIFAVGSIDALAITKEKIERLAELFSKRTIIGVKLYPGYQPFYPNDEKLSSLYDMCRSAGIPIIFHCGDTITHYHTRGKLRFAHPLHIDDVAGDFPDLKIIIAHMGNPWLVDCAEVLHKNKNVYADLSGFFSKNSFRDAPYLELVTRRIKDSSAYAGSEKLLYGTDWPLAPMGEYIKFVQGLSFSDAELERIFYKNAVELFKLNV